MIHGPACPLPVPVSTGQRTREYVKDELYAFKAKQVNRSLDIFRVFRSEMGISV